jgi:protein-S-isoprenylcysteine O-methyltransferase Ste14
LVATLFVLRSEPAAVSASPFDWSIAIGSTVAPFFFAPSGEQLVWYGRTFIVIGVLVQIIGLLSLNRSFGLVAARRTIKTGGIYQLVRHPLYASYLLTYVGYLLINGSAGNILICLIAACLLVLRMMREERFLARDADYRIYMRQVKYRLLPLIF